MEDGSAAVEGLDAADLRRGGGERLEAEVPFTTSPARAVGATWADAAFALH